jgi:hypothetical protein
METNFIIDVTDKFYHEANEWMWDYCTFLGKYISSDGTKYDLGILLKTDDNLIINEYSLAIVYDNKPGSYVSSFVYDEKIAHDFQKETLRRARLLNLIK